MDQGHSVPMLFVGSFALIAVGSCPGRGTLLFASWPCEHVSYSTAGIILIHITVAGETI